MAEYSERVTSSGQVHNGKCHLCGITVNKFGSQDTIVRLHDSLDDSGPIRWEAALTNPACIPKNFWPWLQFYTGIYLKVTGPLKSVILELGED